MFSKIDNIFSGKFGLEINNRPAPATIQGNTVYLLFVLKQRDDL